MAFLPKQNQAFPTNETQVQPQLDMGAAVDQAVAQIEEIDEVEKRVNKASAYQEVMHMEVFGDDKPPEFYEVEKEIQDFARERMRVYLGMQPDSKTVLKAETTSTFSLQQEEVLRAWADGLIQRPQLLAATAQQPQRGRPAESQPAKQPAQATAPVAAPTVGASLKRPRGRPAGSKNQKQSRSTNQQPVGPASVPSKLPVGTVIDPETGRPVLNAEFINEKGETVVKKIDVTDQNRPANVQPIPWPTGHSPLENAPGVNAMRVVGGMENSASSAVPLDGSGIAKPRRSSGGDLSAAINHFNQ